MDRPTLYLSRDIVDDWLSAIEFGTVDDGQPSENWLGLSEQVGLLKASPFGAVIGFLVKEVFPLDLDHEDYEPMWDGPRFDVPVLGLRYVCAAEICLAAHAYLGDEPTVNRAFFHAAMDAPDSKEAVKLWRVCLE